MKWGVTKVKHPNKGHTPNKGQKPMYQGVGESTVYYNNAIKKGELEPRCTVMAGTGPKMTFPIYRIST